MSICHWNCRGYRANFAELKQMINDISPSCICLQETMCQSTHLYPPSQYTSVGTPPDVAVAGRPGEGLAILLRTDVPCHTVNINTTLKAMSIRIKLKKLITVCNLYIAPNEAVSRQDLETLINQLPAPFVIVGDLNARNPLWGDNTTNRHGLLIEQLMLSSDLYLLNTGHPTHFHTQTASFSCIDIALCSLNLAAELSWEVSSDLYGSDHFPAILWEVDSSTPMNRRPKFLIEKADWKAFKALTTIDIDDNDIPEDIDAMLEVFNSVVINAANSTIPKSTGKFKSKPVPWWNQECKVANEKKKTALRKYQHTRSNNDKINYNRLRAISRRTIREARRKSWQDFVSSINSNTPMSAVWSRVGKVNGKWRAPKQPTVEHDGHMVLDPKEVSDILADHFASVSSRNNCRRDFIPIRNRDENIALNFASSRRHSYNDPVSAYEVKSLLRKCRNTAPGEDEINYVMLRNISDNALQLLIRVYNKVWCEGVFPSRWREAIILPFPKPNKPEHLVSSFRPIALTSCVCKLLEKVINARLVSYLEVNELISPFQYGFRKMRSTADALVRLESVILNSFAEKKQLIAIFFDIEKAYDTTWRRGILRKLHSVGIRGPMAFFIRNFLTEREFKVLVSDRLSDAQTQEEGVPQGSVLSVTLFALAIDDITRCLPQDIGCSLYVDDFTIYISTSNIPSAERRLQIGLNNINEWTINNGFRLSPQKTVAVQFHRGRGLQREPQIFLGDRPVVFRDSCKFLGLHFDQRLRWKIHVENLKNSCLKAINILKVLSHSSWGSDRVTLLRLYRSLIRSKLDYGSQVYMSASQHVLSKLDPVHNLAIRICTGAFRSSPVNSLLVDSGEPPLDIRRKQLALQHSTRLKQLPDSAASKAASDLSLSHLYDNHRLSAPFSVRIERIMRELPLHDVHVIPHEWSDSPLWNMPENTICEEFCATKKIAESDVMKRLFLSHVREYHDDSIHIYTDGSKTEHGVGSATVTTRHTMRRKLNDNASIFTAELYALLDAVTYVDRNDIRNSTIFSDSQSAIAAIRDYGSTNPLVVEIQRWIIRLASRQKVACICWVPSHVGVHGNEEADREAVAMARSPGIIEDIGILHRDYYSIIRAALITQWQDRWTNTDNNKLRNIKETVRPWNSSSNMSRKFEVVLCRLRIGHTRLTHGHLMEQRPRDFCQSCLVPQTVEHFMIECPDYSDERRRYFGAPTARNNVTLRNILTEHPHQNFNSQCIRSFLVATGLVNGI